MKILLLTLFWIISLMCSGQAIETTEELPGKLVIAVVVPDEAGLSEEVKTGLLKLMKEIASENRLIPVEENYQFTLVPTLVILEKGNDPSERNQHIRLQLDLFIVDVLRQSVVSQISAELTGHGNNEDKAILNALSELDNYDEKISEFVLKGREAITEFYTAKCNEIVNASISLAEQQQFEEALFLLLAIPESDSTCYRLALDNSDKIYSYYINHQCDESLEQAVESWHAREIEKVEEYLSEIFPGMDCYEQAVMLKDEISSVIMSTGKESWDFNLQTTDTIHQTQISRITAAREVAREWADTSAKKYFNWSWLYADE